MAKDMLVAQIKLAWWRDTFVKITSTHGKAVQAHELLTPLAPFITPQTLPLWEGMVQARIRDIYPESFKDDAEAGDFINQTAGGLMRLAAHILAPNLSDGLDKWVGSIGFLHGFCLLTHAQPMLQQRGRIRSITNPILMAQQAMQRAQDLHPKTGVLSSLYPALLPAQQVFRLARGFIATGQMLPVTIKRITALWRQAWGRVPIL